MMETIELHMLGVGFRSAPTAIREALSFTSQEAQEFLRDWRAAHPDAEALILSTGDRTEFYFAGREAQHWIRRIAELRPDAPILHPDCYRYELDGIPAARHLFRVAGGLNSAVPGGAGILEQVKDAFATATAAGTARETLNRAFTCVLRGGAMASSETAAERIVEEQVVAWQQWRAMRTAERAGPRLRPSLMRVLQGGRALQAWQEPAGRLS